MKADTVKSRAITERYLNRPWKALRQNYEWSRVVHGRPEEVFPLLCPSREADWIQDWDAELIYTVSGYAEGDCVFRTDPQGTIGAGVWVFTRWEEGKGVELVRFTPDLLIRLRVNLEASGPDLTSVHWSWVLTGLTEEGNAAVEASPSHLNQKGEGIGAALDHYLSTGKVMELPGE